MTQVVRIEVNELGNYIVNLKNQLTSMSENQYLMTGILFSDVTKGA